MWLHIFAVLILIKAATSQLEVFVVGGETTRITHYPHSVYLNILCKENFICGGSILNQVVVLTAAHCLEECTGRHAEVYLKYGNEQLDRMRTTKMKAYYIHERYDNMMMDNDIALALADQPFKLGYAVKRVAVMPSPPRNIKLAFMAGWGIINARMDQTNVLMDTVQEMQSHRICSEALGNLPQGTFCAGPISGPGAPDLGDSGSALVFRDYIQIGLVSYKVKEYTLVVYTNVSYHYHWIKRHSARLVCTRHYNKKR